MSSSRSSILENNEEMTPLLGENSSPGHLAIPITKPSLKERMTDIIQEMASDNIANRRAHYLLNTLCCSTTFFYILAELALCAGTITSLAFILNPTHDTFGLLNKYNNATLPYPLINGYKCDNQSSKVQYRKCDDFCFMPTLHEPFGYYFKDSNRIGQCATVLWNYCDDSFESAWHYYNLDINFCIDTYHYSRNLNLFLTILTTMIQLVVLLAVSCCAIAQSCISSYVISNSYDINSQGIKSKEVTKDRLSTDIKNKLETLVGDLNEKIEHRNSTLPDDEQLQTIQLDTSDTVSTITDKLKEGYKCATHNEDLRISFLRGSIDKNSALYSFFNQSPPERPAKDATKLIFKLAGISND